MSYDEGNYFHLEDLASIEESVDVLNQITNEGASVMLICGYDNVSKLNGNAIEGLKKLEKKSEVKVYYPKLRR